MENDLKSFAHRLTQPWLSHGSEPLNATFTRTVSRIQALQQSLGRPPIALICEPKREPFLGHLLACIALHTPVFITHHQWRQPQWQQVAEHVSPDLFLGDKPWLFSSTKIEYKLPFYGTVMIPTGGSAGHIKFAIHTWSTLTAAVRSLCTFLQTPTLHAACTLPLYHVSGLMQAIRTFYTNGQLLLTDYKTLAVDWPQHRPHNPTTTLSLVPTQLQRLIATASSRDLLKTFDILFLGGAAADPALLEAARIHQLPIMLCYGATETAAMIAAMPIPMFLEGQPLAATLLPKVEAAIEHQQIQVKAPSLCHGIYPHLFPPDTFMPTGDEGYLNDQGNLVVRGRIDRLINTGGEKVDPLAVETAIRSTGLVDACMIVAEKDAHWGQTVVALYRPSASFQTQPHLETALKALLPNYQIPKIWRQVAALPLTRHGKPDRQQIDAILGRLD